jgi:hypothetical protein
METVKKVLIDIFGVPFRAQTYSTMFYLLLAFPLGLMYFIFLITGLSLGFPLILVWIGIPILVLVFAAWYGMCIMERGMAIQLLHEEIPPIESQNNSEKNLMQRLAAMAANPVTWKGLVFLLMKFPMGIISFILLTTGWSISGSLLAMPFYYQYVHPNIQLAFEWMGSRHSLEVTSLPGALLFFLSGILFLILFMHIANGFGWISGKLARVMLGNFNHQGVSSNTTRETPGSESILTGA